MKSIILIVTIMLLGSKANSQASIQSDSTITVLKSYMSKTRYPAVAAENDVQGQMVIAFKVSKYDRIGEIEVVKPLSPECDSSVVQTLRKYPGKLTLPATKYTVGLHFIIEQEGKSEDKLAPFDKSLSDDFLFELNIMRFIPKSKKEVSIDVITVKKN